MPTSGSNKQLENKLTGLCPSWVCSLVEEIKQRQIIPNRKRHIGREGIFVRRGRMGLDKEKDSSHEGKKKKGKRNC